MKKNKETKEKSGWQKLRESPDFLKNLNIYSLLSFIFILSSIVLIYRYINKPVDQTEFVLQKIAPVTTAEPAPVPDLVPAPAAPTPVPPDTILQNDRLTYLENKINELQGALLISHQLVAFEMLQGVLDGHLPLATLTVYLQKISEPWTTDILNTLSSVKEIKTYSQLQSLLTIPSPPLSKPISFWNRIKNTLKSFVRVRKLESADNNNLGNLKDIQLALHTHDIQQALEIFGKMPPKEQAELSLWKQAAQDRLTLETVKQKILLQFSGS